MKSSRLLIMAFVCLKMCSIGMAATNYYVATNGPGPAPYTNWATAASNIQAAIDVTLAGDTVYVSNGVYNTGGVTNYPSTGTLTNRVAIWKNITVRSANNDPVHTIIMGATDPGTGSNGPAAVRCVYITAGAWLIGFTLTNGATLASGVADDKYGGGVYGGSISNCIITGNSASSVGGGTFGGSTRYNCTIVGNNSAGEGGGVDGGISFNCTIIGNSAYRGGGVRRGTHYNCTLSDNSSVSDGGGALSSGGACNLFNCLLTGNSTGSGGGGSGAYGGTLYNCTIVGNSASYGGGGYNSILYNCTVVSNTAVTAGGGGYNSTLYNCTVVGNSATYGGGMRFGNCLNCIVYYNTSANWYDTSEKFTNSCTYPTQSTWQVTDGNITNDPSFVNTNAGNYRLSQVSPCINAGANAFVTTNMPTDMDGHHRIDFFNGIVDMGCYEYLPSGAMYRFGF
jgi:hypothetical protein